jgi:hypothetical protein
MRKHKLNCDQCEMLSINGVACHETGCPNSRKRFIPETGLWARVYVCRECGSEELEGYVCCAA